MRLPYRVVGDYHVDRQEMYAQQCVQSTCTNRPKSFLQARISDYLSQVTYCGGYSGEDPPLPIPNREVKLTSADGTAPPGGRVGSCRFSNGSSLLTRAIFFVIIEIHKFMQYLGEILALLVSFSWTISSIYADLACRKIGTMSTNVIRLFMSFILLGAVLWITVGHPYPVYADGKTILWLALSALVGYNFGDWCLFNSYMSIGARFGQLLMTLAPPIAALTGWIFLGEKLSWTSLIAMVVTLAGLAISILGKGDGHKVQLTLPLKGVIFGVGAALGQGVGLVLSKIGLTYYAEAIPADAPEIVNTMLPFASTMLRAIVGGFGFLAIMALRKEMPVLGAALKNGTGMKYTAIMTVFGPALGVSMSLMAVRYTSAGIASTLMALSPVFIMLPYAIIFKQKIRMRELIGVAVTMLGVALFFLL